MVVITIIQAPHGIRFDCSGCANCCLEWPVPITGKDLERISKLPFSDPAVNFKALKSRHENFQSFSHTLEKRSDGRCSFLSEDKLCSLHKDFGVESKPSMCRLFPYSFTVTPDAVRASLSFASSAVLLNSGTLLCRQTEHLAAQFQIFQSLFEPNAQLWHKLQIIDGWALSFEEFQKIERHFESFIYGASYAEEKVPRDVCGQFDKMSALLLESLPDPRQAEREPGLESRPKIVDQILLKHLERLYFPDDLFANEKFDLDAQLFLQEIVSAPQVVSFGQGKSERRFSDLIKIRLGRLSDELEELLDRFFYVRIFARLYFGPGFHHLSLLAGVHHLQILYVLLRLKLKQLLLLNARDSLNFEHLSELMRCLDRRLTQLDLSPASLSVLEVMLSSRQRFERLAFLAQ